MSNTGTNNSGDCNSGNRNSGDCNSGNRNSGDYNSGYCNSGDYNSGYCNSGDYNSGYCNSGYCNSGYCNNGNRNSGDCNSGYCNSGYCNSGDYNSGYCNSGNRNSGCFNTDEPYMRCFNKETTIKRSEFSMPYIDLRLNYWISEKNMTEEEKNENPSYKTTGGFLKTVDYKTAWRVAWEKASNEKRQEFLDLPNFDPDIFLEITGIDVRDNEEEIEIDGKKFSKSTIKNALKQYIE